MMRRCILELSSRGSLSRLPSRFTTQQTPYFLSSRKGFSASSRPNVATKKPSETNNKPAESGSVFPKFVVATVVVGAAVLAAYQTGYLGKLKVKEEDSSVESIRSDIGKEVPRDVQNLKEVEKEVVLDRLDLGRLSGGEDGVEKSEDRVGIPHLEESVKVEGDSEVQDELNVKLEEDGKDEQQELPSLSEVNVGSDERNSNLEAPLSEEKEGLGNVSSRVEQNEGVSDIPVLQEAETKGITHIEPEATPSDYVNLENMPEGSPINHTESSGSLFDEYFIQEKDQGSSGTSLDGEGADPLSFSKGKETSIVGGEELKDAYISKDGKLVLDFLQAIHEAEKRQAELDAHVLAEEKRMLKEKYEKELKDARARQLMYAEEAALLDKELNKERTKAAATVKSLKEKAEENLRMELQRKEEEVELQLKKVQELAKAELAAAIASEKAAQIEKMAEANLHINALCMAFYARSEEARQSQSVHKLALGALALEDALSKGLPIQAEIAAMQTYLESIGRDSLIDLVLSSLPEEALKHGTDTKLQLNWKFDALKGMLRHYSLIPPRGGGMLAHGLAHVASLLKMREDDDSGDGIESVINRVERFLAEGRLAEAADALEAGVSGSEAQEIICDWVRQARNRAITEQALSLLQSYATSTSLR